MRLRPLIHSAGRALSSAVLALLICVGCGKPEHNDGIKPAVLPTGFSDIRKINQAKMSESQASYSQAQLAKALRVVAQILLGRDPSPDEVSKLSSGIGGYEAVIKGYFDLPEFKSHQLDYYRGLFELAGMDGTINNDEPANLAVYAILNDLPFTEVLTATYCVGNDLKKGTCSSFGGDQALASAKAAGVVTTQAFLKKWAASFNFRRVRKIYKVFECRDFPDNSDAGLSETEISATVKTFNCTTCVPACYSCHKVLNTWSTMLYTFDRSGKYNPSITDSTKGQNGDMDLSILTDTGKISYAQDVITSTAKPRYHGYQITTLREGAVLMSKGKSFRDCVAQRMANLLMGRDPYSVLVPEFQDVRDEVTLNQYNIKKIILQIAKHPAFVNRQGGP